MKTIIAHDYLASPGGSEKVLEQLAKVFSKAEIFCLFKDNSIAFNKKLNAKTSILQKIIFSKKKYPAFAFLFPFVVSATRLKADLIISSSHSFIKNFRKPKSALHICYCHTPFRYAWHMKEEFLQGKLLPVRIVLGAFLHALRFWDKNFGSVDYFVANSKEVKKRIKEFYNRDSTVIYPPVETTFFTPEKKASGDYYLVVSRLVPFKRIDLAINAFKELGKPLVVVGEGRASAKLQNSVRACANITFVGNVEADQLREYYRNCKALIFPQAEDFGITAVEVQACGKPVVALAKGGALETVVEGKTGHFFKEQTAGALAKAVKEFERMKFTQANARKNAEQFSTERFRKEIKSFVESRQKIFRP
ncbi:MAG: glycosyltransferase [archaeon]|jgi:glycosyltransferase involved in cell wall biosynthesis|nr:glycosyltransferase [archaeon]